MKKLLMNLVGFALITVGAGYAFYHTQSISVSAIEEGHEGHDYGEEIHVEKETISPEERDPNRLWCREHGVYEDECSLCHPELASEDEGEHEDHEGHDPSADEGLFCAEHQVMEEECGICQPQLAESLTPGEGMLIRLPSLISSRQAGIQTGRPLPGSLQNGNSYLCEVVFNENRIAHISPLAKGVIQEVYVSLGDEVEKGQILMEVASTEVAKAKSDYLNALNQEELKRLAYEREKQLQDKEIAAKQDFHQAKTEYEVAQTETMTTRQQLLNYGLTEEGIEFVRTQRSTTSTLKLRAPFSGRIVNKHAVLGEAVDVGQTVFELVDLSSMWLTLNIPEVQIEHVNLGDPVQATFSTLPNQTVGGELTWISSSINEKTRMLTVRAEVENPERKLKQGLFGKARIVEPTRDHILVPQNAVQNVDGKPYVFVKREEDLFELRHIVAGNHFDQQIEIHEGLSSQEEITIAGSFVLKSEFLKSRFGAGCAEH